MPRVSAAEKARTRARILKEASKSFRVNGLDGTSVSEVMSAAGLTHGGFYRHFKSKDELLAAAIEDAIKDAMYDLESANTPVAQTKALRRYVNLYLSHEHVRSTDDGCPLAAVAADAGRSNAVVREATDRGRQHVISLLARALAHKTEHPEGKARWLFSLLLGTITLARVACGPEEVNRLLEAAKKATHELMET